MCARLTMSSPSGRNDGLAVFDSRLAYTLLGAVVGLGLVVWALMHDIVPPSRAAMLVGAGPLFGAFAGFDLYATRHWSGRLALLLRLELSCVTAASLTGLCGLVVGAIGRKDMTALALLGAGVGFVVWLSIVLRALRDRWA